MEKYLTKEQHEELVTDVDAFNTFIERFEAALVERIYLETPMIVLRHIQQTQHVKKLCANVAADIGDGLNSELFQQLLLQEEATKPGTALEDIMKAAVAKYKEKKPLMEACNV